MYKKYEMEETWIGITNTLSMIMWRYVEH